MKLLAFMQNPWFPEGTALRMIMDYRDNQDFHRRMLMATMSGSRLQSAFKELFIRIIWDNVQWRPDWMLNGVITPDYLHVQKSLNTHQPTIVITFGNVAYDCLSSKQIQPCQSWDGTVMRCHHPNARFRTQADLDKFAYSVRMEMLWRELHGESTHVEDVE